MTKYTIEHIKKAKRFRVTDNKYFDEDVTEGKWYDLHTNEFGEVYFVDDGGFTMRHFYNRCGLTTDVKASIAEGIIEYDIPDIKPKRQPKFFTIENFDMHRDGVCEYRVVTDASGGILLREIQQQCSKQNEIARLERQRNELDAKIAKLKEATE